MLLLDTDLEQNDARDRDLTHYLYGGNEEYRLKQELLLGVGGVRILEALGFGIGTYHLNEGHAAFATVELLKRFPRRRRQTDKAEWSYDADRVRDLCVFTTHTPVEAGHDRFSYDLVARIGTDLLPLEALKVFGGPDHLNMTRLALNLSGYVNGVAQKHAITAREMFPGFDVHAVTNGVHVGTWAHPAFAALYQAHYPQWMHEPEVLVRADQLPDAELWSAHEKAKGDLCQFVREHTGVELDPNLPVIGFARRMTGYKRPDLLFSDLARLAAIAEKYPFQLVLSGKAHPADSAGKESIHAIHKAIRELSGRIPVAFPAQLRHVDRAGAHCRRRRVAEQAGAAARSIGHERHESGGERSAQPEHARRLVGRRLHRRRHRLVHRRRDGRRAALSEAGGGRAAALLQRSRPLDLDDEAGDQQDRVLFQQPPHDEALRGRGLLALMP